MRRHLLLPALTLLCTACAVLDSKSFHPELDPTATRLLHGRFSCTPTTVSHAVGFSGPPNLAEMLGAVECDTAILDAAEGGVWTVSLERYGMTSVPRRIDAASGLRFEESGGFSLPTRSNCGSGSWTGCHDARILVFVDTEGDLVAVQGRGEEGVLTLLPEKLVGRRFAVFPRIRL